MGDAWLPDHQSVQSYGFRKGKVLSSPRNAMPASPEQLDREAAQMARAQQLLMRRTATDYAEIARLRPSTVQGSTHPRPQSPRDSRPGSSQSHYKPQRGGSGGGGRGRLVKPGALLRSGLVVDLRPTMDTPSRPGSAGSAAARRGEKSARPKSPRSASPKVAAARRATTEQVVWERELCSVEQALAQAESAIAERDATIAVLVRRLETIASPHSNPATPASGGLRADAPAAAARSGSPHASPRGSSPPNSSQSSRPGCEPGLHR